jgi:TonB family protein
MLSLLERDIVASVALGEARPLAPVSSGFMASVVAHVLMALALFGLVSISTPRTTRPLLTFAGPVRVVYLPSAPIEMPKLELSELRAPKEVLAPEPAPERPLAVLQPIETPPIEKVETPEVRPTPAPPRPAVAERVPPPTPTVGLFAGAAAVARTPDPARRIESAGFDAPVAATPQSKLGTANIGAFDNPATARAVTPRAETTTPSGFDRPQPRADSRRPDAIVVADTGFGRAPAVVTPVPESRTVRDTGFGASTSREQPRSAEPPPAAVTPSGFSNAREVQAVAKAAAPAAPRITPVELLSKPTPSYTDEARRLKIEGEVLLEVEFAATGSVTILRVVRGLGHGLDEAAMTAAKQIRFKPAQDSGRAVDYRTTVHIVFRLA